MKLNDDHSRGHGKREPTEAARAGSGKALSWEPLSQPSWRGGGGQRGPQEGGLHQSGPSGGKLPASASPCPPSSPPGDLHAAVTPEREGTPGLSLQKRLTSNAGARRKPTWRDGLTNTPLRRRRCEPRTRPALSTLTLTLTHSPLKNMVFGQKRELPSLRHKLSGGNK